MPCTTTGILLGLLITGATFLAFGGIAQTAVTAIVHSSIRSEIPVTSNTSMMYSEWSDPSAPLYMQYFFFNVTNPENVTNDGALPNLELFGPFTYIEKRIKNNVTWDGDLIHYKYTRTFTQIDTICEPDQYLTTAVCTCNYSMPITNINVAMMGLASTVNTLPAFRKAVFDLVNSLLATAPYNETDQLFVTHTVQEWAFGYNDTFLEYLSSWKLIKDLKIDLPSFVALQQPDERINVNISTVYSGAGDLDEILNYEEWVGVKEVIYKPGTEELLWDGCVGPDNATLNYLGSKLNGSEGFQFPPFITHQSRLAVFTEDLQRSSYLEYNSSTSLLGIDLYRFVIEAENFANSSINHYNCAFSDFGPFGVLNMTALIGAPVFGSLPHFYKADPYYRTQSNFTWTDDPVDHDTYIDVEPYTGATMRAHQRLQVNVQVLRTPNFNLTNNVKEGAHGMYIPVMYADENGELTQSLADQYKNSVGLGLKLAFWATIGGVGIGSIFLVAFIIYGAKAVLSKKPTYSGRYDESQSLLSKGYTAPYDPVNS